MVFDAAFATQGLGDALDGSLDPDLTSVLTEQATLDEAAVDLPIAGVDAGTADDETPVEPGAVTCYPTAAPFTRLAEAKTAAAASAVNTSVLFSVFISRCLLEVRAPVRPIESPARSDRLRSR